MSHHDVDPVVDPVGALRAELSRVEVSPEFAERVRRHIGEDVMASIGAELSELSVSPAFAVRVRQQIETAPARSRWFGAINWRWAVPMAAAAVIAAIALTRGGPQKTTGVAPSGAQASASVPQAPHVPQAAPPSIAPVSPETPAPSLVSAGRVTERTSANAAASSEQAEDKLEVITNQPAILRQLWAAAVATVEVAEVPREMREIVIVPVEVTPVAVQWLVEPPPSGGAAPIIRRVSADAERSDK